MLQIKQFTNDDYLTFFSLIFIFLLFVYIKTWSKKLNYETKECWISLVLFNVIFVNLANCDLIKNQYTHILKIYVNKNHSLNKSIWVHWLNFVSWLRFKYINVWYKRLDGSWINFLQCSVYFSMFMYVCACEQILIILLKYEPQKLCKLLCAGTRTHGTTQGTQVHCP